uniref:Uncharacterized protein n=1 Tax=Oryza punctata TaxID=4537 RepID=A0A0E0LCF1_ORYPU
MTRQHHSVAAKALLDNIKFHEDPAINSTIEQIKADGRGRRYSAHDDTSHHIHYRRIIVQTATSSTDGSRPTFTSRELASKPFSE